VRSYPENGIINDCGYHGSSFVTFVVAARVRIIKAGRIQSGTPFLSGLNQKTKPSSKTRPNGLKFAFSINRNADTC